MLYVQLPGVYHCRSGVLYCVVLPLKVGAGSSVGRRCGWRGLRPGGSSGKYQDFLVLGARQALDKRRASTLRQLWRRARPRGVYRVTKGPELPLSWPTRLNYFSYGSKFSQSLVVQAPYLSYIDVSNASARTCVRLQYLGTIAHVDFSFSHRVKVLTAL